MHLRVSKNNRTDVSLNDMVGLDKEGNAMTLMELLEADNGEIGENLELEDSRNILYNKLNILDETEKFVVIYRYGLGNFPVKTQREIGKTLGISRSYVSRIEKRAITKLEKSINK